MKEIDEQTLTQVVNIIGEIRKLVDREPSILRGVHPQHVRDLHDRLQRMSRG